MFAKPHRMMPNCRVADVDHTFTIVAKQLPQPEQPETNSARSSRIPRSSLRTGDGFSYAYNPNTAINIHPKASKRMYRILSYVEDKEGRKIYIDMIDGRVYGKSPGVLNRISKNVVLYESKEAALSERFPYNQVLLVDYELISLPLLDNFG
jgi:hypothetical protein